MTEHRLLAHSLAEAHLYLLVQPCPSCSKGPLRGGDATTQGRSGEAHAVSIGYTCGSCGRSDARVFHVLAIGLKKDPAQPHPQINPTGEPSRILDVPQWLTLFRMIVAAADKETDKIQARHLGIEAAQCLDEALRFYGDDDHPPATAFFQDSSGGRPNLLAEQFSKRRLLQLRSRLPAPSALHAAVEPARRKPSWWRRWLSKKR